MGVQGTGPCEYRELGHVSRVAGASLWMKQGEETDCAC